MFKPLPLALALSLCFLSFGVCHAEDTPEANLNAIVKGLEANQPGVIWDYLPATYQKDINELIALFAGKMDAEIYNKAVGLVKKSADMLKKKKELILQFPMLAMFFPDKSKLGPAYDQIVEMVDLLANSQLKSLDTLKVFNVKTFLDNVLGPMVKQSSEMAKLSPMAQNQMDYATFIKGVKIETISQEENTYTIKISAPQQQPETMVFVKVDEKWVPQEMAAQWSTMIQEAKANINGMMSEEMMKAQKPMIMAQMAEVEKIIDQIAAAENVQALSMILTKLMQ